MTIGEDSGNCKTCGKVIYNRANNVECDDCKNTFLIQDNSTVLHIDQTWVEIECKIVQIHDNNRLSKKQMITLNFEDIQKMFDELKKRGIVK